MTGVYRVQIKKELLHYVTPGNVHVCLYVCVFIYFFIIIIFVFFTACVLRGMVLHILAVILLEESAPIFMVLIQCLAIYHSINLEALLRTRFTFVTEPKHFIV